MQQAGTLENLYQVYHEKGKVFLFRREGVARMGHCQKCWISRLEAMQACFIDCLKKTEGKDFYKSGTQYNVYNMYMHHPHSGIVGSSKNAISLIIAAFTLFPILQLFFRYGICRPAQQYHIFNKKKSTHDISFVLLPKSVVSFHIVVLGVSKTQRVPVKSALKI